MKNQKNLFNRPPIIYGWLVLVCIYSTITFAEQKPPTSNLDTRFSFEKVQQLKIGSTQDRAKSIFGLPNQSFREKKENRVIWMYSEGTEIGNRWQRLGLTFSGPNLQLTNISYYPMPPDKVLSFEGLKAEFPTANFLSVRPSSCGEHYQINEGYEYDLALGISFQKGKDNQIRSLNISEPSESNPRKTASDLTGCPDKSSPRVVMREITPALK